MQAQTREFSSNAPIGPSQFASELQQLLGHDFAPDPLFLEESWTVGVPAALDNWHHRLHPAQRHQPIATVHAPTIPFAPAGTRAAEVLASDRAARVAQHYSSCVSGEWVSEDWTPQDWTPQDRIAQRWIPQGWTPLPATAQNFAAFGPAAREHSANGVPRQSVQPQPAPVPLPLLMSRARACQILGVTPSSTREQVRSAYRQLVSQWHPDRLQQAASDLRQLATDRMAELNEAYHLLRDTELAKSA